MKTTSRKVSRIGDQAIVNDLAGKIFSSSRRRLPFIIASIVYIFKFFLSIGAFIPRCLFRSNLGQRTFGVITLIFIYFFFAVVQIGTEVFNSFEKNIQPYYEQFSNEIESSGLSRYDVFMYGLFLMTAFQEDKETDTLITMSFGFLTREAANNYKGISLHLFVLWIIILLLSFIHYLEQFLRKKRKLITHSYYRGKSLLFSFLEGKKVIGWEIKNYHIWMFIEPTFIFFLSLLIDAAFPSSLLGPVFRISAFFLLLEEYRVYLENRTLILDLIDSQMDGQILANVQEKYQQQLLEVNNYLDKEDEFINVE